MNTAKAIEFITCQACGVTVEKKSGNQKNSCGKQACKDRIKAVRNRERCAEWAKENRSVVNAQPWLLGQPIYDAYLPGRAFGIEFKTKIRWPIELRNSRLVHGMVTKCLGQPHIKGFPMFSLVPWAGGLGVYVHSGDWSVIANRTMQAQLADQKVEVRFFNMSQMRTPQITKRGRRVLTIETLTPVSCRNCGGNTIYTEPDEENLLGTLRSSLAPRLGLAKMPHEHIVLKLLGHTTTTEEVELGGKYQGKPIVGWHGIVTLEANAVTHWLLECAARGWGLGGRTAFGFGRIKLVEGAR